MSEKRQFLARNVIIFASFLSRRLLDVIFNQPEIFQMFSKHVQIHNFYSSYIIKDSIFKQKPWRKNTKISTVFITKIIAFLIPKKKIKVIAISFWHTHSKEEDIFYQKLKIAKTIFSTQLQKNCCIPESKTSNLESF